MCCGYRWLPIETHECTLPYLPSRLGWVWFGEAEPRQKNSRSLEASATATQHSTLPQIQTPKTTDGSPFASLISIYPRVVAAHSRPPQTSHHATDSHRLSTTLHYTTLPLPLPLPYSNLPHPPAPHGNSLHDVSPCA